MTDSPLHSARLGFLLETVTLEAEHLRGTDARLFSQPFTAERAKKLGSLAEALNEAHLKLPLLKGFVAACKGYAEQRKLV
jgi:hypothetical protein